MPQPTPKKMIPRRRSLESPSSSTRRQPLVDEEKLARLPPIYRAMHGVLMTQPADWESYTFPYPDGLFRREGHCALLVTDIVDVINGDMLNAPILQIWCRYVLLKLKICFCSSSDILYIYI